MRIDTSWTENVQIQRFNKLTKNIGTDVLVIGGGLTGILTAYILTKHGLRVVLVEKGLIAEGATHMTTALLTKIIDTNIADIIRLHGETKANHLYRAHEKAIDLIESIAREEKIDCEFKRCTNYMYANNNAENKELDNEYSASEKLEMGALRSELPAVFENKKCIEFPNQAKFHPLLFISGLTDKILSNKGKIFENTEIESIDENEMSATTKNGKTITTSWIMYSTYTPPPKARMYFKKGMYTSYVLELETRNRDLQEGIYEDMDNPYHYFRIDSASYGSRIIIGGEDHREDLPVPEKKNYDALSSYAKKIFKNTSFTVRRRWSGPILEPSDGLPFIGRNGHPHILYAYGFSGNGMTYAGIAAQICSDIILGNSPGPAQDLFSASRSMPLSALFLKARDYIQEMFKGAFKNFFRRKNRT